MSRHAVIKLKLRAVIGDFNFDDVVQYASGWAMNSIPMASIAVAVGRNVDNQRLATIHEAIHTIAARIRAEVYLTALVKDVELAMPGVPDNQEIKVFEGRVVGTGWQRTETGANFTIHMMHWLGDLNNGSAVSASLHPGSPGDLAYPAVFPAIGLTTVDPTSSPLPAWVPGISSRSVNSGSFSDMWGNILLPWMKAISNDDPYDDALGDGSGDPDVLAALERIKPNTDGVELNLDLNGADGTMLADAMRGALVNEIGGSWINTTLWGKLVGEWAPAYWFSVIPRVEDALIVPFTGGLRGAPWAMIGDEDYAVADINSQLNQLLRAVGIAFPIETSTGFDAGIKTPQVVRGGLLGAFRPEGITTGMVLLKDAPKWLSDPMSVHMMSLYAEGVNGTPINTAVDQAGVGNEQNPPRDVNATIEGLKGIASAYAEQWYVLEYLKGRMGEVGGKLRFDIAPGSNVLVKAGGARNVPQAQAVSEDIYATVMQVSYVINSEAQRAGTAFSLAHVRSAKENSEPGTSIDKPPLYQQAWFGAKLIPDAPGPEPEE